MSQSTIAEMNEDNIYDNEQYETILVEQSASSTQDKRSFELHIVSSQTTTNGLDAVQANIAYGQPTFTSDIPKANRGKCIKAKIFAAPFLVLLLLAVTVAGIALSVFNTINVQTLKAQSESAANTSAISMRLIEETQNFVRELRNDSPH